MRGIKLRKGRGPAKQRGHALRPGRGEEIVRPHFKPQPGPQELFLSSTADIAIFGGAAGGGKTMALLLDAALCAISYKGFGAVIFRRTCPQVTVEGGLWDTSEKVFPFIGGVPTEGKMQWDFPAFDSQITFAHLEHDKTRYSYQGAQIAYIGFDELTHFSEKQFWYLVGRNRSDCACPAAIRATCNPDPDHFVSKLISWWINDEGYAIDERSGVLRYLTRDGDDIHQAGSVEALKAKFGPNIKTLSFTFIRSRLEDNPILLNNNPQYLSNLMTLPTYEREQLRFGNWKIRPTAGSYFRRHYFEIVEAFPRGYRMVRYWDRAATEKAEDNAPDWTVGLLMTKDPDGIYYVCDVIRDQLSPGDVLRLLKITADIDGPDVEQIYEQDPAAAGKAEAAMLIREMAGYSVKCVLKTSKQGKQTMARPVSSQAEAKNIRLVRGEWIEDFLNELVNFPQGANDDQVDTLSGAFRELTIGPMTLTEGSVVMQERKETGLTKNVYKPRPGGIYG